MESSGDDVSSLAGIQSHCDEYNNDSLLFAVVNIPNIKLIADGYCGISAGHGRGI